MLIGHLNSPELTAMDLYIRLLIEFGDLIHLFFVFRPIYPPLVPSSPRRNYLHRRLRKTISAVYLSHICPGEEEKRCFLYAMACVRTMCVCNESSV